MRLYRGLAMVFFLLLFLALPTVGEARGGLESEDFTIRGIALGDAETKMLAAFGKPDFDKERTVKKVRLGNREPVAK